MTEDREQWVEEFLADLDIDSLLDGEPQLLDGATGPQLLVLEPGDESVDPPPTYYVFESRDTRLDVFPGALIFHFADTHDATHRGLQAIFEKVVGEGRLVIESLQFDDTSSSQIAIINPDRAR